MQMTKPVAGDRSIIKQALADILFRIAPLTPEILGIWYRPATVEYKSRFGTLNNEAFDINRGGFASLVEKWEGQRTIEFRVMFIEQFNALGVELRP